MRKVLVTGGTGFLGSWVCAQLHNAGWKVSALDVSPKPTNLDFVQPDLSRQVDMIEADIRDAQAVAAAVEGFDAIVHLAGLMTLDCAANPVRGVDVNLIGSLHLLQAATTYKIDKFIYISTAGVYGPDDNRHPCPTTEYGVLKLAVEGLARLSWLNHGLPSLGLRPYVIYGPGESTGIAAGASIACRAAAYGQPAEIRFSGAAGFVHVKDVAQVVGVALDRLDSGAHLYDLGGEHSSVEAFVDQLKQFCPGAQISISGGRLKLPERICGGDSIEWLDKLAITPIELGIRYTLEHLNH